MALPAFQMGLRFLSVTARVKVSSLVMAGLV